MTLIILGALELPGFGRGDAYLGMGQRGELRIWYLFRSSSAVGSEAAATGRPLGLGGGQLAAGGRGAAGDGGDLGE